MRWMHLLVLVVLQVCFIIGIHADDLKYYHEWCKQNVFVYNNCTKHFPSSFNLEWSCPISYSSSYTNITDGWQPSQSADKIVVDRVQLDRYLTQSSTIHIFVILIRRTTGGVRYKYFGRSNHNYVEPYQPWSSSKVFAISNGARRIEATCPGITLNSTAEYQGNNIPLGDLATIIHSYDTHHFTSNSLGSYFEDIGDRRAANDLVHSWLKRPATETFGGNYGEKSPSIGYQFRALDGRGACSVTPDHSGVVISNHMSAFSMANWLQRLVLHREDPLHMPYVQWRDVIPILYGSQPSKLFPGLDWGGMSSSPDTFMQGHQNMTSIDIESRGQWRIFSKVGWGTSDAHTTDNTLNGYACYPQVGAHGELIPNRGVEFVISARVSTPAASFQSVDKDMRESVAAVIDAIRKGHLV